MTLHNELNKITKVNDNQINWNVDQTNKELIKKIFIEYFDKINNSIISKLFYATNCNSCKYEFSIYYFLVFLLEGVSKYKHNNYINNNLMMNPLKNDNMLQQNKFKMNKPILKNNNINEVNIFDCFDFETKENYLTGENQMYCIYCRSCTDCIFKTNLYTGPEVLILILHRGKGIGFNIKLNFTEELNLSKYIENKESGYMYKLIGVITYLGENYRNGHFFAYCKDPINGKWFKYNDAIVNEVNDFKKEVLDFAKPYVLFYEKIKNPI